MPSITLHERLVNNGFDPSAAEIYLILANSGELAVKEIVQKSSLSRAGAYDALSFLEANEFVSSRKKGRHVYYKMENPEKLMALRNERRKEVAVLDAELAESVRLLAGSYNLSLHKPGVRFFEGIEGMKEIYQDTLNYPNTDLFALLSPRAALPEVRDWLNHVYAKKRAQNKIFAKVIATNSPEAQEYKLKDEENFRKTILVPNTSYPVDIEINVYGGNKIAFISFKESEMIGTIIESQAIHSSMKSFFLLAEAQAELISGGTNAATRLAADLRKQPPL